MTDVIRIANCSGFYGDRLGAARELVDGGPIDVLTGDYLAELTMSILHRQRVSRGEDMGYVGTFLKQVEEVAATCKERNIKIVSNAGGLNPQSLAQETENLLKKADVSLQVAYIDGDDLQPRLDELIGGGHFLENLDTAQTLSDSKYPVLTANAYLGAWGIKEALEQGADIVICPRVTDAAVVMGAAAWKFNWARNDFDALAGALAAGHIIECGAQCCGGNFAFFEEVPSFRNVGYPIAEIEADGSFTITKHPGTGGLVSVDTVKAQLLYEISGPDYLNPDVVAHFDTMEIEQIGPDRVRVSGTRGSSPPPTHKVCINTNGPAKKLVEVLMTGLDIEKKADLYVDQVLHNLGGRETFDDVEVQLIRSDKDNPENNEVAHATLRMIFTSDDPRKLGRLFSAKVTELGLACVPGITGRASAGFDGSPVIIHWPALIDSAVITERVHFAGRMIEVLPTQRMNFEIVPYPETSVHVAPYDLAEDCEIALGRIFGSRSGDKGGNANCGVWARSEDAYRFLYHFLTVERFKVLCPDIAHFEIERYEMPNLLALNFQINGLLGTGAGSNHRIDRQAKTLGEYLRAKRIRVPQSLVPYADN